MFSEIRKRAIEVKTQRNRENWIKDEIYMRIQLMPYNLYTRSFPIKNQFPLQILLEISKKFVNTKKLNKGSKLNKFSVYVNN